MAVVVERSEFETLERLVRQLQAGVEALTERIEQLDTRTVGQARLGPTAVERDVSALRLRLASTDPPVSEGQQSVADVAALGPFRASPHAKETIAAHGGRVVIALYDPSMRDAILTLLNGR